MDPSLVELITEMVLAELARSGPASVPQLEAPKSSSPGRRVLVAAGAAVPVATWEALVGLKGISWLGVAWPGCSVEEMGRFLKVRVIPTPTLWCEQVAGVQAVVLPSFPVDYLPRLASLLSEPPPVAAALAGIVQGVPVLASNLEVERIRRHSARLPAAFLQVFQQQLRTVEAMGVQFLEPPALAQRLQSEPGRATTQGPSRGRDVVTLEDLEAARRNGVKLLELSPGSIVTPLARDAAHQMGIEVRFR